MLAHQKNALMATMHSTTDDSGKNQFTFAGFRRGCFGLLFSIFLLMGAMPAADAQQTVVQKYGQLRVSGNKILDQSGTAIQLRGMSLYWSQWIPKYWTYNTVKWLRDDWKITVIRAAMGVNGTSDGYLVNPTAEKNKVIAVVDAAIQLGIYVIIDWHDHSASQHRSQAQAFFADMAQRYGNTPNVIYETWNEPINDSWSSTIKPYHQALISTIRQYDADNIIVCGTGFYSQNVDEATADPLTGSNLAYTLHYYAGSHGASLRSKASTALGRGKALFVTEYGTTDASGDGNVDVTSSNQWWDFMDQNKLSSANWSVSDIGESSSALVSGASPDGGWTTSQIKQSGQIVRAEIRANAPDLSGGGTGISNGTYRIMARNSGKVLDVAGASTADGANIVQYTSSGATNQQWTVTSLGSGAYSIRAVHSGKSMDLSSYSTADGADINQYTYSGGANQQWKIESVGSGYYRIVSVHSGKAVEITGNSTANDAGINQRTYSGASNQQFTFTTVSGARVASSNAALGKNELMAAEKAPTVYPNPSPSSFTITADKPFTYTVKDMNGKAVASGKAEGKTSFGNNLPRGMYLLQITTAEGTTEMKLVKN